MQNRDSLKEYFEVFELDVIEQSKTAESNSSEVYILTLKSGNKVVLKIPYNSQKHEREKKALELLKGKVSVPQLLKYHERDGKIPGTLLISYIDIKCNRGTSNEQYTLQFEV